MGAAPFRGTKPGLQQILAAHADEEALRQRLDILTSNRPGAAPDMFSQVALATAAGRASRIGMGRAATFLTGLPGLGDIGSTGSTGSTGGRTGSYAGSTREETRRLRTSARANLSLFGDL